MSKSDLEPIIEISWTNWKLQLYENFLRINRGNVLGFISQWLKGSKDIYFKNITAIQLKKPGLLAWYIQFSLLWGNESRWGIFSAVKDENTVSFNWANNYQKALEIKEYIEERANASSETISSSSDEIEKLHWLMKKGIITKEEFEQKKKKLLKIENNEHKKIENITVINKQEKPWYKKWWAIALFIFIGLIIIANISNNSNEPNTSNTETTQNQVAIVFDLEKLYGKNIEEIRSILGNPTDWDYIEPTQQQVSLGTKEWDNTFEKDGYILLVTYNISTRSITDFFLSANNNDNNNRVMLMQIGNLRDNANNYSIEEVKALSNPSKITGIKIIEK